MSSPLPTQKTESTIPARPVGRLLTVLGVFFGISVTIGNTIGSGILRTPGQIAQLLPSAPLFLGVWILGALYAGFGSNALAELGTMMPESGGFMVFVRRGLGPFPGFVMGWSDWLSTCSSAAVGALLVGEYFVALAGVGVGLSTPIASAVVIAFALIQWAGVMAGSRAQTVTSVAKTAAFIALIVACFALGPGFTAVREKNVILPHGFELFTALVISMQAVIFTYDGYYAVTYFSGEVKNPGRDIPRSIFGGLASIALIYLLVNVAFLYVLPMSKIAGAPLVAAAAARAVLGAQGDTALRALTIVSLLSAVNAFQLMASRVLYRLGAQGFLPAAERVNVGGTPVVGLLLSTLVVLAMILTGTVELVIALTAFFFVANYVLTFGSLLRLRETQPDAPRPFRAKGHPLTTWGVFVLSIVFLLGAVAADTRNSIYSLILLALSWPLYLLVRPKSGFTTASGSSHVQGRR